MAYAPQRIYGPAQPNTAPTDLYTVPTGAKTVVKEIILANTTGSAATIILAVVASADTGLPAAKQIVPSISVPANKTVVLPLSLVLNAGDILRGQQGTAGAITVTVSAEVQS